MSFASGLKTIVVATDLEGRSEAALEYARKLASGYGARIILAHGADPIDYAVVDGVPGKVWNKLSEQARSVLDQLSVDLLREGIHSHSEVRQGAVVEMLIDVAKQYQAGLIVVGTRGRQGAGPIAVGSITEELVRKSECPVLAVAGDWNAGEYRPVPGGPVMLAMEQNHAMKAAVDTAVSLARCSNGRCWWCMRAAPPKFPPSSTPYYPAGTVRIGAHRRLPDAPDRQGWESGGCHRGCH